MFDFGGAAPARHILGNYELFEEVGRGGMGIVYRALDLSLDRIVAIKILRDDLRTQPQIVSRFRREAKAVACLDHPNIVQIYSVGGTEGTPYIAMEFVDSVPLSTLMQRDLNLNCQQALDIAAQVASALACAHDAQVIHRDIKPPNILITESGRAFVTDFGIAKILTTDDNLTVDGSRLGTPHYMSPERCKNEQLTGSSDLYSLGVLLFQMLTGRLPHEASSSVDLIRKIISEPPTRLRHFRPDAPENVERLVAWMIEKNPKHRPADGQAVCDAIERVRQGQPLDTGNSSMTSVLADFRHSFSRPAPVAAPQKLASGLTPFTEAFLPSWRRRAKLGGLFAALLLIAVVGVTRLAGGQPGEPRWDPEMANPQHWEAAAAVADFKDESRGVALARVNVPRVSVTRMAWAGNPPALIVQLDGAPDTHQGGRRVICGLNPMQRWASIIGPPPWPSPTLAHGTQITALAFSQAATHGSLLPRPVVAAVQTPDADGTASVGALYAYSTDGTLAEGAFLVSRIPDALPGRIEHLAIHPHGSAIAAALKTGEGQSQLERWTRAPDGSLQAGRGLLPSGAAVSMIQYSPDGSHIAVLRGEDPDSRELWLIPANGIPAPTRPFLRGPISIGAGAFRPDGTSLAVTERSADGRQVLRIRGVKSGQVEEELGEAWNACWHPTRPRLFAAAADRKDLTQLWALETESPHRRAQLTYLDSGTTGECTVSPDGAWAATAINDSEGPTIVLIDVSGVRF